MAVNVETLDKLERRITLTLAATQISGEVESRLKKLSRTVKAAGFRPGKVPMSVVAQRYGYSVQYEVMNDHVGRAFSDATAEAKLRIAGAPKITQKDGAPEGQMVFDATFEIYPEVKHRRPVRGRDRVGQHRSHRRSHRPHGGHPAQAAPHLRAAPCRGRGTGDRSCDHRFRRQDRRRGLCRRQGRGLPVHHRRRPDAGAVRQGRARHEGRRVQDLRAAVPCGLSRQGRGRQGSRFPRQRSPRSRRKSSPMWMRRSPRRWASKKAASRACVQA